MRLNTLFPDKFKFRILESASNPDVGNFSILFVPGARKKQVYFTLGGGIGKYQGELNYHKQGYHSINDSITNFNIIKLYKGETIGYNAIIGLTFSPLRYVEIETFVTGRFAKIPEIKDGSDVFVNPFKDGKKVPLDFTGIDLRLGIKLIIP